MSEPAEHKAWSAHALDAIDFARRLPESTADWTPAQRAQYDQLLAGVRSAADRHDAADGRPPSEGLAARHLGSSPRDADADAMAPTTTTPLNTRGYMNEVTFDGEQLIATGTTKASRIALRGAQHADGPLVVRAADIMELSQRPQRPVVDLFVNGRMKLRLRDGRTVQLHYRPRKHRAGFDALAKALRAANPSIA